MPQADDFVPGVFGLDENPFTGRFQLPLLPQSSDDLERLYALVDGFKHATTEIDKWSATAAQVRNKPFVALIFGPKGSGRSSTAKYIAFRCAAALKGDPLANALLDKCLVEAQVEDEHSVVPATSLLRGFFNLAYQLGIELGEPVVSNVLNMHKLLDGSPQQAAEAVRRQLTWPVDDN